jgi:hypothetical protein
LYWFEWFFILSTGFDQYIVMENKSERTNSVLIYQDFLKKTSVGIGGGEKCSGGEHGRLPKRLTRFGDGPAWFGSVLRRLPAFHLLLGVDAVAMAIQGDAIMHAAVAGGRHLEKPAGSLIGYQRSCTAFRHETDDAAVDGAARFGRLIQAFVMCAFVAAFKSVHGQESIWNRRRGDSHRRLGE